MNSSYGGRSGIKRFQNGRKSALFSGQTPHEMAGNRQSVVAKLSFSGQVSGGLIFLLFMTYDSGQKETKKRELGFVSLS
jgi:hypothetical protein